MHAKESTAGATAIESQSRIRRHPVRFREPPILIAYGGVNKQPALGREHGDTASGHGVRAGWLKISGLVRRNAGRNAYAPAGGSHSGGDGGLRVRDAGCSGATETSGSCAARFDSWARQLWRPVPPGGAGEMRFLTGRFLTHC
jgi:hypothetical protein